MSGEAVMTLARKNVSAKEPLLIRVDALLARLGQALQAIESAKPKDDGARGNRSLHETVGASLSNRLATHIAELSAKRTKIVNGTATASVWSLVNARACSELLDEALLYLQAAHSRQSDSTRDLCEIVDQLFGEIGNSIPYISWKSYSVFSAEDSFDKLTDVIRVRYPISAAWDIPITVHEFGHYVSDKILTKSINGAAQQTIRQYILTEATRNVAKPNADSGIVWTVWLEEMFADIFATLTLGPAFGYSSILLRFDPAQPAAERDGKHLADA
jgi:hypothetical protein